MLGTILGIDLRQTDPKGGGVDKRGVSLHEDAPCFMVSIPYSGPDFGYVLSHLRVFVELSVRFLTVIEFYDRALLLRT